MLSPVGDAVPSAISLVTSWRYCVQCYQSSWRCCAQCYQSSDQLEILCPVLSVQLEMLCLVLQCYQSSKTERTVSMHESWLWSLTAGGRLILNCCLTMSVQTQKGSKECLFIMTQTHNNNNASSHSVSDFFPCLCFTCMVLDDEIPCLIMSLCAPAYIKILPASDYSILQHVFFDGSCSFWFWSSQEPNTKRFKHTLILTWPHSMHIFRKIPF